MRLRPRRDILLLLPPLLLSAIVYWPLTRNYFRTDDFLNLYRIVNGDLLEYLLIPHGGHVLLARNALFWLFFQAFGTEPAGYFWAVLVTHLANVFLLFHVIRLFTGSARLACFGATLWGISPVHEGALGWYSVYGQVVAATALLALLLDVGRHRAHRWTPSGAARCRWYALALLCCTSFGVGIGIALTLPFAVALLLPASMPSRRRLPLLPLLIVVPALYVGVYWLHSILSGEAPMAGTLASGYLSHWADITPMLAELLAYGTTQLLLPFLYAPASYPDILSHVVMAVVVSITLLTLRRSTPDTRRQLAAFFLIAAGCYGMIALGRASIYPVFGAAAGVTAQRYHYAAFVPLTLFVSTVLASFPGLSRLSSTTRWTALCLWLGIVALTYTLSMHQIDHHDKDRLEVAKILETIRSRVDQCAGCETVKIANRPFEPLRLMIRPRDFPGWAAVFILFYPNGMIGGTRVQFADWSPHVLEAANRGKRTKGLFVEPAGGAGEPARGQPKAPDGSLSSREDAVPTGRDPSPTNRPHRRRFRSRTPR